ncbi:MAG: hypothetical protein AB8F78_08985 [Saprospiraceae bacterium]
MGAYYHVDSALPEPYSGVVGDSRIIPVPGTTSPQIGAAYCPDVPGVYIWDSYSALANSGLLSNPTVQGIVVYGDFSRGGNCKISGIASGQMISIFGTLAASSVGTGYVPIIATMGSTLFHEIVHTAGLNHAFVQNECTQIDLGDPSTYYAALSETSNNIMDYNYPNQSGANPVGLSLSPCQWSKMYCEFINRFGTARCEKQDGVTQITDNETIGIIGSQFPLTINKNIEILSGAELTLNGQVKFAPGVAIVVRRGSRLIIDNADLSSCNQFEEGRWEGIFIEGNFDLEQPGFDDFPTPDQAGVVKVLGSNVRDAISVLRTCRYEPSSDYNASWDQSYWGGVMYVDATDFIDNKRVAEFMKYEKENKSYFQNTKFYGQRGDEATNSGITSWATNGIEIKDGCAFYEYENQAIFSINSFFKIDGSFFRENKESVVLEYTRSHSIVKNEIGVKEDNEFTDNEGSIRIISSDYQDKNNSNILRNSFVVSGNVPLGTDIYYVETYGAGQIVIDENSFAGAVGDAFVWSVEPKQTSSISCNVFSGSGAKNRGVSISGDQTLTRIERNIFSGMNSALIFRRAAGVTFNPKTTQGDPGESHGNLWTGNVYDIISDGSSTVSNHAEITYFSHTFLAGQSSEYNPDQSSTYGGNQRVVMDRAFDEKDCEDESVPEEPIDATTSPCDQFASGGLSPDHPNQKNNVGSLYSLLKDAYGTAPVDGSGVVDFIDCLTEEDQIRVYYLSLNFSHDENLFQAVRNSESLSSSDIAGLERARQVWLLAHGVLEDEEFLGPYEVTCADSKLAKPFLREHNLVFHRLVSTPDYLSCADRSDDSDVGLQDTKGAEENLIAPHTCESHCANVTYSLVNLLSGEEERVAKPSILSKIDFDAPYRYLKVTCPDHGAKLTRKVE